MSETSRPGRSQMRVKLCAQCPFTPGDFADYYDPKAELHACAKCDHLSEIRPDANNIDTTGDQRIAE